MNRVGQAFHIDHGSGHSTLRVVVEDRGAHGGELARFTLAVFDSDGSNRTMTTDEATLAYWCRMSQLDPPGNVKRVA